jgi:hypothetical protein
MMQMPSFLPRQARDKHRDSSTQNKGDADRFALHTRQVTADRHGFFKYMAQSIAEKHGMRATFMPKPFINLSGAVSLLYVCPEPALEKNRSTLKSFPV